MKVEYYITMDNILSNFLFSVVKIEEFFHLKKSYTCFTSILILWFTINPMVNQFARIFFLLIIYSLNVLPIVMGPNRSYYESVGPSNSFIHVDDFSSPKYLAAYLHKLDKNDTLYNEYFQWKTTGTIIVDTKFYCRLCAMVHDTDRPPKHYDDINKWWNGTGICL